MGQLIGVVMQSSQPNGFEICEALVKVGFKLLVADTRAEDALSIARKLSASGSEVLAMNLDITGVETIEKIFSLVVEKYGRIDFLVNNTIVDTPNPAETLPIDHYWELLTSGLKNVFFGCQLAARRMITQEPINNLGIPTRGIIVNITSICSVLGFPGLLAYCSSMAAINTVSKILASEWGPQGIKVEVIVPGLMDFLSRYQFNQDIIVDVPNLSNPLAPQSSADEIAGMVSSILCNERVPIGTFNYIDNGYLSYGYI